MNSILSYWAFDWRFLIIIFIVIAAYILLNGLAIKKKLVPFGFAILLLIVCFFSPLQILSAHYLFSVHMIVHVILLLLAGPLLVLSLPKRSFHFFSFFSKHPFASWIMGVGIMWFWHIPTVFNYSMGKMHGGSHWISIIEIISLLASGIIFSAPLIHPFKQQRINPLNGVVYLFTACIGCSLLGILISFADTGTYHHFLSMHDVYGINVIISGKWKMTQRMDQQIAGLIMWVPCCFIYVSGAMYLLVHWFKEKETRDIYLNKSIETANG